MIVVEKSSNEGKQKTEIDITQLKLIKIKIEKLMREINKHKCIM